MFLQFCWKVRKVRLFTHFADWRAPPATFVARKQRTAKKMTEGRPPGQRRRWAMQQSAQKNVLRTFYIVLFVGWWLGQLLFSVWFCLCHSNPVTELNLVWVFNDLQDCYNPHDERTIPPPKKVRSKKLYFNSSNSTQSASTVFAFWELRRSDCPLLMAVNGVCITGHVSRWSTNIVS